MKRACRKPKVFELKKVLVLIGSAAAVIFADLTIASDSAAAGPPSSASLLYQVGTGLIVVTAAILVLAWLAKRIGPQASFQQSGMKIVSSLALGTKEKIILIEVENKKLLLGVTASNISRLHVFEGEDGESPESSAEDDSDEGEPEAPQKWDFSRYMAQIMKNGHGT